MERDFKCIQASCRLTFTVKEDGEETPGVPDVDVVVKCPDCQTPIPIQWPRNRGYIVVPKKWTTSTSS